MIALKKKKKIISKIGLTGFTLSHIKVEAFPPVLGFLFQIRFVRFRRPSFYYLFIYLFIFIIIRKW